MSMRCEHLTTAMAECAFQAVENGACKMHLKRPNPGFVREVRYVQTHTTFAKNAVKMSKEIAIDRRRRPSDYQNREPLRDELGYYITNLGKLQMAWEYVLVAEGLALDRGREKMNYGWEEGGLDFLHTPQARKRDREYYLLKKFLTPRKRAA